MCLVKFVVDDLVEDNISPFFFYCLFPYFYREVSSPPFKLKDISSTSIMFMHLDLSTFCHTVYVDRTCPLTHRITFSNFNFNFSLWFVTYPVEDDLSRVTDSKT